MSLRDAACGARAAVTAVCASTIILHACASTPPGPAALAAPVAPPRPPVSPPGPAKTEGPQRVFGFFKEGRLGKLFHGVPDSDDLDLLLDCRRGSERVSITDLTHPQAKPGQSLTLASGGVRATLPAKVEGNEESDGNMARAEASMELAPLKAFRKSGRIALSLSEPDIALWAKADSERTAIEDFFAFCDRKR